jgi:hypothetical protein
MTACSLRERLRELADRVLAVHRQPAHRPDDERERPGGQLGVGLEHDVVDVRFAGTQGRPDLREQARLPDASRPRDRDEPVS